MNPERLAENLQAIQWDDRDLLLELSTLRCIIIDEIASMVEVMHSQHGWNYDAPTMCSEIAGNIRKLKESQTCPGSKEKELHFVILLNHTK